MGMDMVCMVYSRQLRISSLVILGVYMYVVFAVTRLEGPAILFAAWYVSGMIPLEPTLATVTEKMCETLAKYDQNIPATVTYCNIMVLYENVIDIRKGFGAVMQGFHQLLCPASTSLIIFFPMSMLLNKSVLGTPHGTSRDNASFPVTVGMYAA